MTYACLAIAALVAMAMGLQRPEGAWSHDLALPRATFLDLEFSVAPTASPGCDAVLMAWWTLRTDEGGQWQLSLHTRRSGPDASDDAWTFQHQRIGVTDGYGFLYLSDLVPGANYDLELRASAPGLARSVRKRVTAARSSRLAHLPDIPRH